MARAGDTEAVAIGRRQMRAAAPAGTIRPRRLARKLLHAHALAQQSMVAVTQQLARAARHTQRKFVRQSASGERARTQNPLSCLALCSRRGEWQLEDWIRGQNWKYVASWGPGC